MTAMNAFGQYSTQPKAKVRTIPALILNRSSRVMPCYQSIPGFLGTPAGITTISAPRKASANWSCPTYPVTLAGVLIWERSAATPFFNLMNLEYWRYHKGLIQWSRDWLWVRERGVVRFLLQHLKQRPWPKINSGYHFMRKSSCCPKGLLEQSRTIIVYGNGWIIRVFT